MAIFHFSVKIIGRNKGLSAVAAAAYRSGEKLYCEYDGQTQDYTKKKWVSYKEIVLPTNAPVEYLDRPFLWNKVERIEKSADAQLCREFELSLPKELTLDEQIELVKKFVDTQLISNGFIVDFAIHNPPVRDDKGRPLDKKGNPTNDISQMEFRNPHVHILCPMRPLDKDGNFQKKAEIEYLCMKDGVEKGFTATEFKRAKSEGWQKQYQYLDHGKKVYYIKAVGFEKNLKSISRAPKTTRLGRPNPILKRTNSREYIISCRFAWQDLINDKFKELQMNERVDARSLKAQGGEEEVPTLPYTKIETQMLRKAFREIKEGKRKDEVFFPDKYKLNQEIQIYNQLLRIFMELLKAFKRNAKYFINKKKDKEILNNKENTRIR